MATDNNNKKKNKKKNNTLTIEKGDTLSGIAEREGTTVEELSKINEIANPDEIQAGATLELPSIEETTETVNKPQEPIVSDEDVPDELEAEDFNVDIQDTIEKNKKFQKKILDSMTPSEKEKEIKSQLQNVREQADKIELDQKKELLDLEKSGIGTMAGMNLAEESISRRDALKLETLQREESNLLDRLGLKQEARELRSKTAEKMIQFNTDNLNTMFKIQNRIRAREERQKEREEELTTNAQDTLNTIVDNLSGIDPTTLDAEAEARIAELAKQAGIPVSTILSRLQLDYDKRIADVAGVDKAVPQSANIIADQLLTTMKPEQAKQAVSFGKIETSDGKTISFSSKEQENIIKAIDNKAKMSEQEEKQEEQFNRQEEMSVARDFIKNNPDVPDTELRAAIKKDSNLTDEDIDKLFPEEEGEETGNSVFDWIKSIFD